MRKLSMLAMLAMLAVLAVLVLLGLATFAHAAKIEIGPYIQDVRPDGAIVVWETDAPMAAEVVVETPSGERHFPSPAGRHHEVRVSGLGAGRHRYRVVAGEASSDPADLQTAPLGNAFTFLVYGDNRDGHANHARVVAAMIAQQPDLLINTGDLTSDGDHESLWRRFFEIEKQLLASVPLYPALGNHEVLHDRQATHYHRFFALPGPPAVEDSERYYSFRYANSEFIALDSNESSHREQARWLLSTLAAARADPAVHHLFVFFHHPPFSVGSECGSAVEQGLWVPAFEHHKVRAVFVGHEHAYEHMERGGVRYFVTGGGGAPLRPERGHCPSYDEAALRLFRAEHHFIRVRVLGDQATLDAISADGVPIETVSLHEPMPPEPTGLPEVPYRQQIAPGAIPLIGAPAPGPSRSVVWVALPIAVGVIGVLLLIIRRLRSRSG